MAGNTKLMGFSPDGVVQLQRWGGTVTTKMSPSSVGKLEQACRDLPTKPKQVSPLPAQVTYSEEFGYFEAQFGREEAEKLAKLLRFAIHKGQILGKSYVSAGIRWVDELVEAMEDMDVYLNTQDEPGVDDDEEVSAS